MDIIEILVLMVCVGVLLYRKSVQKPSGKAEKQVKAVRCIQTHSHRQNELFLMPLFLRKCR